jgi:hypothetical protein
VCLRVRVIRQGSLAEEVRLFLHLPKCHLLTLDTRAHDNTWRVDLPRSGIWRCFSLGGLTETTALKSIGSAKSDRFKVHAS